MASLGSRQKEYELAYDYRITRRLPIIIRIDGRGFSQLTRRLKKPYCPIMLTLMSNTMLEIAKQIDGVVFAFQQSDEITLVLRNDQTNETEPWFGNRVQKIISVTSSIATYEFNKKLEVLTDKPELIGKAFFDARVFAVPNTFEAINNLIWRQQDCIKNAVTNAAQSELGIKFGKKTAQKILHKKHEAARRDLLLNECNIDFDYYYPAAYRYGVGAYKTPKVVESDYGSVTRNKWFLDYELPVFSESKEFLLTIIESGRDIFRAGRDIEESA